MKENASRRCQLRYADVVVVLVVVAAVVVVVIVAFVVRNQYAERWLVAVVDCDLPARVGERRCC